MTQPPPTQRFASSTAGRWRTFVYGLLGGQGYAVGMLCLYREWAPGLGIAMWLAVMLLTFGATIMRRPLPLALGVFVGSLPGTLLTHQYLIGVALAGYVLFPLFISFWVSVYVWVLARLASRRRPTLCLWAAPCVWVGLEYLRGEWVMGGYPWYMLAHESLPSEPRGAGFAGIGGTYSISLIGLGLVWFCAALLCLLRSRLRRSVVAAAILICAFLLLPAGVLRSCSYGDPTFNEQRTLRIACIQTNMSREDKAARLPSGLYQNAQRWYDLSRQAAAAGAELIIWPETMYGGYSLDDTTVAAIRRAGLVFNAGPGAPPGTPARIFPIGFYEDLMALQRELGVPMLVGSPAYDNFKVDAPAGGGPVSISFERRYNSLFLIQNGLADQRRYDKRRLVPFGEYLPLIRYIPGATKWVADVVGSKVPLDCTAGDHLRTFEVSGVNSRGPVRIITPICFEAVYGSTVREMAWVNGQRAADLIVNISNDNWFGEGTRDRYAHLVNAAWRSVETGLPTVRCVNTGVSCVIGADGRVIHAKVMPAGQVKPPGPGSKSDPVGTVTDNVLSEGVLLYDVPIPDAAWTGTIYSRIGDVVPITCTVITGACVLLAVFGRRGDDATATPPASPTDRPQETPR